MYDPSMRVLTVLEMLQTKERVPASELAARLEVSIRTVQRYVARLQDLGVPVRTNKVWVRSAPCNHWVWCAKAARGF